MAYWPAAELDNLRMLGGGQDAPVRLIDTGGGSFKYWRNCTPSKSNIPVTPARTLNAAASSTIASIASRCQGCEAWLM